MQLIGPRFTELDPSVCRVRRPTPMALGPYPMACNLRNEHSLGWHRPAATYGGDTSIKPPNDYPASGGKEGFSRRWPTHSLEGSAAESD